MTDHKQLRAEEKTWRGSGWIETFNGWTRATGETCRELLKNTHVRVTSRTRINKSRGEALSASRERPGREKEVDAD